MRKPKRGWILLGSLALLAITVPGVLWVGLTYRPAFYRQLTDMPSEQRHEQAEHFVAQSLRLRNDIVNEPRWEAVFTDEEVNAWLAEDLVTHFADQIPPGVRDPRVMFENDRLTLAFQLQEGPVNSVVWVVLGVDVPRPNELALTIEKIRAGALPVPAERILDRITAFARGRGVEVAWSREEGRPVATVRYTPDARRRDVVLEVLEITKGRVRLWGKSNRDRGEVASPTLPTRRVLQSTFPRRKTHSSDHDVSFSPASTGRSTAIPWKREPSRTISTASADHTRGS